MRGSNNSHKTARKSYALRRKAATCSRKKVVGRKAKRTAARQMRGELKARDRKRIDEVLIDGDATTIDEEVRRATSAMSV